MFCCQLPELHGNVDGVVYVNISIHKFQLNVQNVHALCYDSVMMRAATGPRLVSQLLHTGHYAAPPKNVTGGKIRVKIIVSVFRYSTVTFPQLQSVNGKCNHKSLTFSF